MANSANAARIATFANLHFQPLRALSATLPIKLKYAFLQSKHVVHRLNQSSTDGCVSYLTNVESVSPTVVKSMNTRTLFRHSWKMSHGTDYPPCQPLTDVSIVQTHSLILSSLLMSMILWASIFKLKHDYGTK